MLSTFGLLGRTSKLTVYAPAELADILQRQIDFFCRDLDYEVAFCAVDTTKQQTIYDDRSLSVETLPLEHRVHCCGYLFREKPLLPHIRRDVADFYGIPVSHFNIIKAGAGWTTADGEEIAHERLVVQAELPRSYAYVSDTRYLPSLADRLTGVSTLYHESTYGEDNLLMAEKYNHSTARQAALIARRAGVGQLLLGHYSSRYEQEEVLLDEAREVFENSHLTNEMDVFDV
jgi:ribonuclease Z